jgi:predicted regulator of Ras-like GTPase activity (Roadblock/LC7/MglB family)
LKSFNDIVREYFKLYGENLSDLDLFVYRADGIPVYCNLKNESEKNSIGALVAGVWQASKELLNRCTEKVNGDFRLTFDTSDSGIYFLKIIMKNKDYYFGCVYQNEINPGQVKVKVRNHAVALIDYLKSENIIEEMIQTDEFLFNNLSDDEIDNMFSVVGC